MSSNKPVLWFWLAFKKGLLIALFLGAIFSAGTWVWERISVFLSKFPGHGTLVLIILFAAILFLGWVAPLLRHAITVLFLRRLSEVARESSESSWVGKEVEYAPDGYFDESLPPPDIKYKGFVTTEKEEPPGSGLIYLYVLSLYPPGATSNFPNILKGSKKVRMTGRGAEDLVLTMATLGRL